MIIVRLTLSIDEESLLDLDHLVEIAGSDRSKLLRVWIKEKLRERREKRDSYWICDKCFETHHGMDKFKPKIIELGTNMSCNSCGSSSTKKIVVYVKC